MRPLHFVLALALFIGFGTHSGRILLTLYALHLGAEPYAIGILAATTSLFPFLLSVWAGKLIDRLGARRPLVVSVLGAGAVMVLPFLFPGLPAVFIAASVLGLSFTFYNVALQNLVGMLSEAQNRVKGFSNFGIMVSSANFVGPLVAGFSIDHSGHVTACLYVAALWLMPLIMLAMWGHVLPGGSSHEAAPKGSLLATLKEPKVRKVLIICSLVQAGFDLFVFYLPVYGNSIGLSASIIGFVLAMFAAATFIARFITQYLLKWFSVENVLSWTFYLAAASLILVPLFQNVAMLAVIAFVFGLGISCGQPITMMLIFSNSEQGRSGEAMGMRLTVNHLTRVTSPVIFGVIATAFGLAPIFWLNAAMLAAGGFLSRANRNERMQAS